MEHELTPVIAILGGGLLAVAISRMTNVTEIVCYFVAGALLGDYGFAIVQSSHSLHVLAEVGLAFFLFEVGSHLSVKKLRAEWRTFLTLGPVHAFVTGGVIALGACALGVPAHLAALLGAILSLSSTAVVLKLLENEGEAESPSARSATAVLLFQDVLAVVLLAILPALAQGDAATLPWEIGKVLGASIVAAAGVVAIARFVLRPFYRWVFAQRAEEVFTAAALLTVLLIASFVQPLGLSLPLGAFLAGVAISETNYSYVIRAEVAPFRVLLLSFFFLSVGMSLDFYYLLSHLPMLAGLSAAFIAAKATAGWIAFRLLGHTTSLAMRLGALLAQGSEFAFALFAAAITAGLLDEKTTALYAGVVSLSLASAAFVSSLGCRLSTLAAHDEVIEETLTESGTKDVIIVGFDELGAELAAVLNSESIPYRGHEGDRQRVADARSRGYNVYISSIERPRTIGRASLGEVSAVVVLTPDEQVVFRLLEGMKSVAPAVPIIIVAHNPIVFEEVIRLGYESVFLRSEFVLKPLVVDTLRSLGRSPGEAAEVAARLDAFRSGAEMYTPIALSAAA